MIQWHELIGFKVKSERVGLHLPAEVDRALELVEVARECAAPRKVALLELSDDDARAHVTDLAIREHQGFQADTRGLAPGVDLFVEGVLAEAAGVIVPALEGMVAELRPRFEEKAAPILHASRDLGFTMSTRAEDVIDLADESASAAFRALRPAIQAIQPIASWRIDVSRLFGLSPTAAELGEYYDLTGRDHVPGLLSGRLDYTVCFAAGDNWSPDGGYYDEADVKGAIDWLALAAGGLRLNSPAEVSAKVQARYQARLIA